MICPCAAGLKEEFVNQKDMTDRLRAIMEHPSYRLAYLDTDFIRSDELRPLRLHLELMKPEVMMDEAGIQSTIVVFGGTRIIEPKEAKQRLEELQSARDKDTNSVELDKKIRVAERIVAKSHYYNADSDPGSGAFTCCVGRRRVLEERLQRRFSGRGRCN